MTVKEIDALIDRQLELDAEYEDLERQKADRGRDMAFCKECDRKMQALDDEMECIRRRLESEGIT